MTDSTGPVKIVDEKGVYPNALDQAVIEQRLIREGRFVLARPDMIFVFGSNEAGIHGAGAARFAHLNRGAKMGTSFGIAGHSFAIPTKDSQIRYTLPLSEINRYVKHFLQFALSKPGLTFQVTCIGCGLAGLKHEQIAPMFYRAPANCLFDTVWEDQLPPRAKFWGTF
jgi:hypothetical protein